MDQRLRGFVAQKLGGPKDTTFGGLIDYRYKNAGSYTVGPYTSDVMIRAALYGAGGGCQPTGDNADAGGGGAASMVTFYLPAGRTLPLMVGAGGSGGTNGGDTTLVLPDGKPVIAGGGRGTLAGRSGGTASGGDYNRSGGSGGSGSAGQSGEFGGAGGINQSPGIGGGGGGSGGFSDLGDYPKGEGIFYVGNPSQAAGVTYPGGGAGSNAPGGIGNAENGAALLMVWKIG